MAPWVKPVNDIFNDPSNKDKVAHIPPKRHKMKEDQTHLSTIRKQLQSKRKLLKTYGVHTACHMNVGGFSYTGNGDTARCVLCKLEVSSWTLDMKPFIIHLQRNPDCPFVSNITSKFNFKNNVASKRSANPAKHKKIELMDSELFSNTLYEIELLKEVRKRTFSHWPDGTIPSSAQMIEAGFFSCNVDDRVICIYCNLICQQWSPDTNDPCEVHKVNSLNCIYVKAKLMLSAASSMPIVNENASEITLNSDLSTSASNIDPLLSNYITYTASGHSSYAEISERYASYATWKNEKLPPVHKLVEAGFFYTGTNTIVTCFNCKGSLQHWEPNDDPMTKHALWFPHCAYARQLCGEAFYCQIQELQRIQQGMFKQFNIHIESIEYKTEKSRLLLIPDDNNLSKLVADRLDLDISQRLLKQHFELFIVEQCWKNQLRVKQEDFLSDSDLYIACLILKKQIEHIDPKMENIVIPNLKMTQIQQQNENYENVQTAPHEIQPVPDAGNGFTMAGTLSIPSNSCVVCRTNEKQLACIPCGHLALCVACSHKMQSCPICRRKSEAFVRIRRE